MLPIERHGRIEKALRSAGVVGTDDVARLLNVSIETIRRDFLTLEQRGVLTRVHGGAVGVGVGSTFVGEEPSYADRAELAQGSKTAIGKVGAGLVSTGQTVIMDIGTTVLAVAKALSPTFRGTVATCSIPVAAELAGRPGVEVLLAGGRVRGGDLALSNSHTLGFFADLRADIAFLGSGGVDIEAGVTDFYLDEIATRRLIISNSTTSYVLADQSKLRLVAPHRVCGLDAVDGLITDAPEDSELRAAVEKAGGVFFAA